MKATPDEIRQRFEQAVEYLSDLESGQTAIIDAPLSLELVARTASAVNPKAKNVLDIGCGAGNYSLKLLQFLPNLDVILLDLSSILLEKATERITSVTTGCVNRLQGDIRDIDLGEEAYDIILAGAVLHHLRDESEWKHVFKKIYQSLHQGGSFWISDLIEHSILEIQEIMNEKYSDYLIGIKGEEFRRIVFEEIANQDTPRSIQFQIDLLRHIGFSNVEILHKNSCFAAFGAIKGT